MLMSEQTAKQKIREALAEYVMTDANDGLLDHRTLIEKMDYIGTAEALVVAAFVSHYSGNTILGQQYTRKAALKGHLLAQLHALRCMLTGYMPVDTELLKFDNELAIQEIRRTGSKSTRNALQSSVVDYRYLIDDELAKAILDAPKLSDDHLSDPHIIRVNGHELSALLMGYQRTMAFAKAVESVATRKIGSVVQYEYCPGVFGAVFKTSDDDTLLVHLACIGLGELSTREFAKHPFSRPVSRERFSELLSASITRICMT